MHDDALDDLLAQILSEGVDDLPDDEKVVIQVGKRCTAYSELGEWRRAWAALRTLPPANTEADLERVARAIGEGRRQRCGGYPWEGDPNLDPWLTYEDRTAARAAITALSLTRPAGGEEVDDPAYHYSVSLLRALHGNHFPEQAALKMLPDTLGVLTQIDNLTSALTKPPALPREGEELRESVERLSQAMLDNYEVVEKPCGGGLMTSQTIVRVSYDDLRIVLACADKALSSLPVRSGEVERLRDHIAEQIAHVEHRIQDGKEMGATVWRIALEDVARENRAALATPQQVKEGDRHG